MKQSAEKNSNENSFSHKANFKDKFKPMREILFDEDLWVGVESLTLIEINSKLLISDNERCLLHLSDFDGKILKSFNLNPIIEKIDTVCVLESDSNGEEIFVGDNIRHKIFVFDSNFKLLFQFGNKEHIRLSYMKIDNEFDKTHLYVSDYINDEITIRSTVDGKFIGQIEIEFPKKIIFARNSVFVTNIDIEVSDCYERLDCCIFEIDKASLEIKRKIILNFDQSYLLSIESNGNLQIAGFPYDSSDTSDHCDTFGSKWLYFLTVDLNGKIIKKAKLYEYDEEEIFDVILAHNKIIVSRLNILNIFEFE